MPQADTVAIPKRFPLAITPENREGSTAKDSKLVNCYVERTQEGDYWVYRRPGTVLSSSPPGTAANGYGMYNWLGDVYSIFGTTLYKNGANVGTVDGTGGVYQFSQCKGATPRMQLGNGVKSYNYDSGGGLAQIVPTGITPSDFPSTVVKGWAYLDETTYVMTPAANIRGSDLNLTQTANWASDNSIAAQIEPDAGIALNKQLVYVIAFKQWTTEVFYDAGNATGSPLAPVQGAKLSHGCLDANSVQEMDGELYWMCTNRSSMVQVIMMSGLKAEIISTKPIERLLEKLNLSVVYSWTLKTNGHRFYILTIKTGNITLVYDITEKQWMQWTDANGNYVPIVARTYNTNLQHLVQHESNGNIYVMDEANYTDAGSIITLDLVTPNFDGGMDRRKTLTQLTFIADKVTGSNLQVRCNDNDYDPAKWSNFRNVDLGMKKPNLTNCGTFIRRAYHLRHAQDCAFRIKALEMQVDIGTL